MYFLLNIMLPCLHHLISHFQNKTHLKKNIKYLVSVTQFVWVCVRVCVCVCVCVCEVDYLLVQTR